MDTKHLNTFLTVSRLLNFTKAAERLGYAQSSITAQIQQLENETGALLFDRIGKKVILTDAGKKLIPYATQILHLSGNIKNEISGNAGPSGTLTIGTSESLSIYRLPAILKEYRRIYPEVDIELKMMSCTEFFTGLSNGFIDIAFTIGTRVENIYVREVLELPEKIKVLAHPSHPLEKSRRLNSEKLEMEALLLTGRECCYRKAFLNQLEKDSVIPRIALETDSVQVIKQAAMSGLGICVLPEIAVIQEIAEGKLIPLDFDTENFNIVSQMFYHKDKWVSPALSEFIMLSKQLFGK